MDSLCVFGGKGFIGSEFVKQFPDVIVQERDGYIPATNRIFYLISTTHNYHVHTNPYLDIETNLNGLIKVLENARERFKDDFEFTFASSWFVYGKTECPAKEISYCNPTGFYSITKRAAEQLLMSYCDTFGMRYKIVRFANVLGIGDKNISRKKNAFQYMVQQVALGNDVDYLYDGKFYRDFIDVRDAVNAAKLVIEKGDQNSIYNAGNGMPYDINQWIHYANIKAGGKSKITLIPVPEFHKIVQVKDMWLDISKIRKLGYKQKYSMQDMMKELVEYYVHG